MKIRTNDLVFVLTGKDRGKTGRVVKVLQSQEKVIVEGVNRQVKHVKGRDGNPGERIEFDAPLHVSNVAVVDPKDGKPTRIRYKFDNNQKLRVSKRSDEVIVAGAGKKQKTKEKSSSSKK
ncbi:50S ribosomal protein L24 [Candidatus Gracilibacteria bacterium]|nr:50S ribosomal protein L24 [Candidatus Gracilibacteria bacterium]MCF7819100.1 50S ribosomal protein L24 [Candidatus Gracilibacteria bacterium]